MYKVAQWHSTFTNENDREASLTRAMEEMCSISCLEKYCSVLYYAIVYDDFHKKTDFGINYHTLYRN